MVVTTAAGRYNGRWSLQRPLVVTTAAGRYNGRWSLQQPVVSIQHVVVLEAVVVSIFIYLDYYDLLDTFTAWLSTNKHVLPSY